MLMRIEAPSCNSGVLNLHLHWREFDLQLEHHGIRTLAKFRTVAVDSALSGCQKAVRLSGCYGLRDSERVMVGLGI